MATIERTKSRGRISLEVELLQLLVALFDHLVDFAVKGVFELEENFVVAAGVKDVLKGVGEDLFVARTFLILCVDFAFLEGRVEGEGEKVRLPGRASAIDREASVFPVDL